MYKFVMKNNKTNEYWCADRFPQLCKDPWDATKYDTAAECQGALDSFLTEKYNPKEFKPVKIHLVEDKTKE